MTVRRRLSRGRDGTFVDGKIRGRGKTNSVLLRREEFGSATHRVARAAVAMAFAGLRMRAARAFERPPARHLARACVTRVHGRPRPDLAVGGPGQTDQRRVPNRRVRAASSSPANLAPQKFSDGTSTEHRGTSR